MTSRPALSTEIRPGARQSISRFVSKEHALSVLEAELARQQSLPIGEVAFLSES